MVFSPHLASNPSYGGEREGADDSILSNSFLPLGKGQDGLSYGGKREGADDSILSNLFLPLGKVRMGSPLGRLGWG